MKTLSKHAFSGAIAAIATGSIVIALGASPGLSVALGALIAGAGAVLGLAIIDWSKTHAV